MRCKTALLPTYLLLVEVPRLQQVAALEQRTSPGRGGLKQEGCESWQRAETDSYLADPQWPPCTVCPPPDTNHFLWQELLQLKDGDVVVVSWDLCLDVRETAVADLHSKPVAYLVQDMFLMKGWLHGTHPSRDVVNIAWSASTSTLNDIELLKH